MQLYYPITVDLYNPHPLPRMNAQQHNVGRGALITLTANGQVIAPNNETVRIFATRPDGNVSYLDCAIAEDGKVQADFTDQMLATEGNVQVELEFTTTETNITTPIFIVEVNKSNVKEGVQSSNEYKALEKYTEEAKEAARKAQEVYDNIPNYEVYKANYIICTATGKTILTTDSANAPLVNLKAKGDTWQRQYEGHQLFDISQVQSGNMAGGILTNNGDGSLTVQTQNSMSVNGLNSNTLSRLAPKLQVGETYVLNANTTATVRTCIYLFGVKQTWYFGTTKTITQEMLDSQVFWYADSENATATIKDIVICKGTEVKPYEPYFGGNPSPNMEYEQPIESLENAEVKVLSGNLFDVDKALEKGVSEGGRTYFKFENGQTYTMSVDSKMSESYSIYFVASSNTFNDGILADSRIFMSSIGRITKTFTIPNDGLEYYLVTCNGGTPTRNQFENMFNGTHAENLQIQLGSETPYEPYTEQTLTLTSPVPITKWDKLVNRDGIWGWSIYHVHLVVDGNSDISKWQEFYIPYLLPHKMLYRDGFCNGLIVGKNTDPNATVWLGADNNWVYFPNNPYWDDSLADKGLANFKAHLNEHPLEILTYADEEQDFIPLSDEEQEMIKSVLMNYPTTTILSNAELEVEYVADTKEHIKQNYTPNSVTQDIQQRLSNVEALLALNS